MTTSTFTGGNSFAKMSRIANKMFVFAILHFAILSIVNLSFVSVALANPTDGVVVSGAATITNTPTELQIHQTTDRAFIDWGSFDIGAGETTRFYQPGSTSIALNRVVNSGQVTTINGNLFANGQVVVINPNGVIIGANGNIDTAGFVASSAGINPNAFSQTGVLDLNVAGNSNAVVENNGTITVGEQGLAALVAPTVRNNGVIQGNLAKVQLAAADKVAVDFYGDGLLNFTVDSPTDGTTRNLKAENNGTIIADGGKVLMTAAAASDVVNSVVNNTGNIQAHSLVNHNGEIILTGEGAEVSVKGKLDVAGVGNANGGSIKVGGDYQGGGTLSKAKTVNIDSSAELNADAGTNGNGGQIIAWSDNGYTAARGTFTARGGSESGNGGLIETSSTGNLYVDDVVVDTTAANGTTGSWLLDPSIINIVDDAASTSPAPVNYVQATHNNNGTSGTANIKVSTINNSLSSVLLAASSSINFNTNVNITTANVGLTAAAGASNSPAIAGLNAGSGDINLVGHYIRTNNGSVTFKAGNTINIDGSSIFTRGASVNLTSGDITISNSEIATGGGTVNIAAINDSQTSGNITISSTKINTSGGGSIGGFDIKDSSDSNISNTDFGSSNTFTANANGGKITIDADADSDGNSGNASGDNNCFAAGSSSSCGIVDPTTAISITITANALSKIYGAVDPTLTYATTGTLGLGASYTGSLTRAAGSDVGAYAITQGTLTITGGFNTYTITYVGANLTITQKALQIIAAAKTKTYGDADPALTYTTSGLVSGDSMTGALTRVAGENAGSYQIQQGTVTVGGGKAGNYAITYSPANLTINKATLTIAAAAKTKVYGDADPALTYSATGFKFSDTAGSVLTGGLTRNSGENVGSSYTINQGTLAANGNYNINYSSANLSITKATLTIIADAKSKVYGTVDPALTYTASGFKFSDTAGSVLTGSQTRASGSNVGNYAITQDTLAANNNYNISYTGANFEITKASLSIVAAAKTKVYGDSDPSLTYTTTGLVSGDSMTGSLSRTSGSNVGNYAINQNTVTVGGGKAGNYNITYTGANLSITPATLTIIAGAKTKTYGDADPALTYSSSGFKNGDTASVITGALARAAGENVAVYAINQGTLTAGSNYNISYTGANFTINKATLTVIANAQTKVYGDADPALTYAASGFKFSDTAGSVLSGAQTRAAGENVGNYAITQGTLAANGNYNISYTGANFAITKAILSVVADAKSKVYGAVDPLLTYLASGFKNGDNSSIMTGSLTRVAGENVGTYTINQGTVAATSNYTISYTGALLTIGKKALQVIANSGSKTYGDVYTLLNTAFTTVGLVGTDSVSTATITSAGAAGTAGVVGSPYSIDISDAVGSGLDNYDITYTAGALTVNKRTLDIIANSGSKTYGDTYVFGATDFTTNGLVNGDQVISATFNSAGAAATANKGSYDIDFSTVTVSSGVTSNYDFNFVSGTLAVNAKALQVIANSFNKTYGNAYTFLGTEFSTNGLVNADSVDSATLSSDGAAATATVAGGPYDINISGATGIGLDNYDITYVDGSLTVDKRALQVIANSFNKTYGDTYTFLGTEFGTDGELRNGDTVNSVTLSSEGAVSTATVVGGPYDINISGATGTGLDNYEITYVNGLLTVDPRTLYITAHYKSKTYGDADPELTYDFSNLVEGDSITGGLVRDSGENVGYYDINQGTVDAGSNYVIDYTGNTLKINRAKLVITIDDKEKQFGESDPEFTFTAEGFKFDDNESLIYSSIVREPGEEVGDYDIFGKFGIESRNYCVEVVDGVLTIVANPFIPSVDIDPINRPIISVANQAINLDLPFEGYETLDLDTDVSLKAFNNASSTNALSNIAPAAGGNAKKGGKKGKLSDIEPAAGGNPAGSGDENLKCGDNFLQNKPCQISSL